MDFVTRRSFMRTTGIVICSCCVATSTTAAGDLNGISGCSLIGKDFDLLNSGKLSQANQPQDRNDPFKNPIRTTGDREKDIAYDRALKRLSETFGVRPSFAFYDDSDSQNAWASPTQLAPDTQGTVVFGVGLVNSLMQVDPSGISVLQVSAHEFAHVTQYVSGTYKTLRAGRPSSKLVELHADFLSGYYLGALKIGHANASLWWAGQKIFEFGDYNYNNPTHHGTPQERVAAAEAGFRISYVARKDFPSANQAGVDYVLAL